MTKAEGKIRLRPHHVLSYIAHVIAEEEEGGLLSLPDKEYLSWFRKGHGNIHSDIIVLHLLDTFRTLHEKPDLKFKYVEGIADSICTECEHKKNCDDPKSKGYGDAKMWDDYSAQKLPELEIGKSYTAAELRKYMPIVRKISDRL